MLRGEAGKLRVVSVHGGTGGIALSYTPREPVKVFVQWMVMSRVHLEEPCEDSMGHRLEEARLNTGDSCDRRQGRRV